MKVLVRFGCIGAVASSGRLAAGGLVTSSNPLLCGNKSLWWGFSRKRNVDGLIRQIAGPGLAAECDADFSGSRYGGVFEAKVPEEVEELRMSMAPAPDFTSSRYGGVYNEAIRRRDSGDKLPFA